MLSLMPWQFSASKPPTICAYCRGRAISQIVGIKAADYLRILPWKGDLVDAAQPMPWPRTNIATPTIADNVIPPQVIEAQLQLTLLANAGTVLIPTYTGVGYLIKEKIGPIENVYSEKVGVSTDGLPIFPGISMLLEPWLLGDTTGLVLVGLTSIGSCSRYEC